MEALDLYFREPDDAGQRTDSDLAERLQHLDALHAAAAEVLQVCRRASRPAASQGRQPTDDAGNSSAVIAGSKQQAGGLDLGYRPCRQAGRAVSTALAPGAVRPAAGRGHSTLRQPIGRKIRTGAAADVLRVTAGRCYCNLVALPH